MKYFAGLDVGANNTAICVVDQAGDVVMETTLPTQPKAISRSLAAHRKKLVAVGQETGGLSVWLHRELIRHKLPMKCLDARTTRAALKAQRNKTDRNDARDIAVLLSRGFKHQVYIKSDEAHALRLLLTCRRTLKRKARDVHTTLSKAVKIFDPTIDPTAFAKASERLARCDSAIEATIRGTMRAHAAMLEEIDQLDRLISSTAKHDKVCQRLMTVPGIGPLTALTFKAAVDDPSRFARSRTVAAYFGLTPRRIQSGQSDFNGRVSKLGDQGVRAALYEASVVMLVHSKTPSALRDWGLRLVKQHGYKFAAVACARKLAVLMHRLWVTERDFQPAPPSLITSAARPEQPATS